MRNETILVVEDDDDLRDVLCETLMLADYRVEAAVNGEEAMTILKNNSDIALLISDVQMQPVSGHELLKQVRALDCDLPFILMTAYGTVEEAVQAMQDGANDYLVKPFEADEIVNLVGRYMMPRSHPEESDFMAVDLRSRETRAIAERVATTDATVLISGESGVGKEVVSRFIHDRSTRAAAPFVAINCAAIPENMLESVLFGYEKGAFTGAHASRAGKFEQAQGGTLLLDEITEMELGLQAKLLRVLQEKEVERLGGRKPIPLDVRILATTNRDINREVAEGRFRSDLYYRLSVFPLTLLPLRERPDDILPIAKRLIAGACGNSTVSLTEDASAMLRNHDWPGNVRELDNVIQRAVILMSGNCIDRADIRFEQVAEVAQAGMETLVTAETDTTDGSALNSDLRAREQAIIISALKARTSRREVAEKLGISPRTLRYKLAKMRDAGVTIPA